MAEQPGRFIITEGARAPAANSNKLLYAVALTDAVMLSVHVCNGVGSDAHISLWIVPSSEVWGDGDALMPPYTVVISKQRVESDSTDGNHWGSPVLYLNPGDRLVGRTDLAGVTFYPHGIGTNVG